MCVPYFNALCRMLLKWTGSWNLLMCAITYLKLGGQQTIRIMTRNHHFCKICFRTVYSTACYLIFYVLILMLDKINIVLKKHIPRNIIIRIGLYRHKLSPMVKKPHVSCFKIYFNLKKFSTFWYTAIFFSGDLGKQTIYLCTIKAWLWVRNIRNTKMHSFSCVKLRAHPFAAFLCISKSIKSVSGNHGLMDQ